MIKRELWIVEFPSKRGIEQKGIRPGIIIADTNTDLILIIPLTSNLEALTKLPYTFGIKKSEINGLEKNSVALILQLQTIDKKRLIHKIGMLEEKDMKQINSILKDLLKI